MPPLNQKKLTQKIMTRLEKNEGYAENVAERFAAFLSATMSYHGYGTDPSVQMGKVSAQELLDLNQLLQTGAANEEDLMFARELMRQPDHFLYGARPLNKSLKETETNVRAMLSERGLLDEEAAA